MIIKSFNATKVYGFLDFSIRFNKDMNFLIGGNGSGKTTALRLINALSVPNFKELLQIPFATAEVTYSSKETDLVIKCQATEEFVTVTVSGVEEELLLPVLAQNEFRLHSKKAGFEEIIDDLTRKNSSHPVVKAITNFPTPMFLGLDRKYDSADKEMQEYYFERDRWAHEHSKRALQARRLISGNLGISLGETEFLVQSAYRRLRELEERQSNKLKNSILLSTFQYADYKPEEIFSGHNYIRQKSQLIERRREIQDALSKLDSKDSRLNIEVDTFFNRFTALSDSLSSKDKDESGISIEWLINKAQIDRFTKILEVIDEHKSKIDALYKPINEFLKTINSFFKESQKELHVNTVGHLLVKMPDRNNCSTDGLSSGERQLLVIFAHAFFNKYNERNSSVFIIDEPELSLHLVWQEQFAETIWLVNPTTQYIFATHSPEIIGNHKIKTIKCRGKNDS